MFEAARFHAPRCDWLAGSWRRSRKVGGKQCRRLPQETTDGVVSGASHPRSDQFALAATHYHLEERQEDRQSFQVDDHIGLEVISGDDVSDRPQRRGLHLRGLVST